ncbi:MAG: GlsB/YeaQ/YmgE family stress response membrane protein [Nitriliruptorales bacterium]|nr:GlsB/YeaQ/YmgE family stress response membrane protein [Nitriliruptorales bacterium]
MFNLIGFLIVGLLAGAIARFLVPGRDPMGCIGTMLLGIAGSYVGGFLSSLIFNNQIDLRASNSFIGAVIGAVVALLLLRALSGRRRRY